MNKKEREKCLFLTRTFLDAWGNENLPRAKVVTFGSCNYFLATNSMRWLKLRKKTPGFSNCDLRQLMYSINSQSPQVKWS